ncbi:MAG: DUF4430 domain-containing protein [Clostridiaceae bacterium]|nr:DUF4430 domain-containing protein [Clostridiaceae bacterium]
MDDLATAQALIAICDIINKNNVWANFTPANTTVNLRIEGITETFYNNSITISGTKSTALDVITDALDSKNITYEISFFENAPFLSSIKDDKTGQFQGEGGWSCLVNENSLTVGLGDFLVTENDNILVYYGSYGAATQFAEYAISPGPLYAGKTFKITLTGSYTDWDINTWESIFVSGKPVMGATVSIGDDTYITDEEGIATIDKITTMGTYKVNISKMSQAGYPAIIRIPEFEIEIEKAKEPDNPAPPRNRTITRRIVQAEQNNEETSNNNIQNKPVNEIAPYKDEDQISDWAKQYVQAAKERGIMLGNDNNEFNPQQLISRAEFTALLVRLLKITSDEKDISFSDVNENDWYYTYVITAKASNLISGYDDNTFRPNYGITREEMAVIINRAFNLGQGEYSFNDDNDISPWAQQAASKIGAAGIMQGADGAFQPQRNVSREMAATVAIRLVEKYPIDSSIN